MGTFTSIIYPNSGNSSKLAVLFGLLLALTELLRVVGFVEANIGYGLIIPLMIIPVLVFCLGNRTKIRKGFLLFLLYIPFEILISNPAPVFQSWQRYILFTIVIVAVSPLLQNNKFRCFRFNCLKYFIIAIVILSSLSFLCFFLGINYFKNKYGVIDYHVVASGFGGLFSHSMLLGPISAIGTCTCVWLTYLSKKHKIIYIILALSCAGSTLFSASRSAVAGALFGCIIIIYFYNRSKSKAIRNLIILAMIGVLSMPLWEGALNGINTKNKGNVELGEYGSRTHKFNARISEIEDNPILGIGFSAIDPNGDDYYDTSTGVIEPGSSWLGILSMIGIIGLMFVVYFIINAFLILKSSSIFYAPLLMGYLGFFIEHLIFEGYIFAGGSVLCFLFWLIVGVATDLQYIKSLASLKIC